MCATILMVTWLLMVLAGLTIWLPLVAIAIIPAWLAIVAMQSDVTGGGNLLRSARRRAAISAGLLVRTLFRERIIARP